MPSTTLEPFPGLCERTLTDLRKIQQEDDTVGPLLKAVEEKQCPPSTKGKNRKFQLLLQQWKQLYTNNGLLFRRYEDCEGKEKWAQLVLPESLQVEVLNSLHSGVAGGHLGEDKTLNRLRERFYWPGVVSAMCAMCTEKKSCSQEQSTTDQY